MGAALRQCRAPLAPQGQLLEDRQQVGAGGSIVLTASWQPLVFSDLLIGGGTGSMAGHGPARHRSGPRTPASVWACGGTGAVPESGLHPEEMDVAEVVARLGGTARADQLAGLVTERALARAVERGEVDHLARGRYGLPAAAATHRAAAQLSATISCLSAAVEQGWEVLRQPDRPWLSVPPNRNVPLAKRRGVQLLRTGYGGTVTPPVETVLECARRLPFPEALAVADSALRRGVVDIDELQVAAARLRGRGAPAATRVALHAHRLARNPLESALRALSLEVPGLHLVPQVPVVVEGVTIHPDLVDERLRLVVEGEGWLYHGAPEQFAHDLWRYTALTVDGWTVARFGHRAATEQQDWVVECLETLARTSKGRQSCRNCA